MVKHEEKVQIPKIKNENPMVQFLLSANCYLLVLLTLLLGFRRVSLTILLPIGKLLHHLF